MQYLLLIYQPAPGPTPPDEAVMKTMMTEYAQFTKGIKASGNFVAGEALQPVTTATTVRVREGKTLSTDGPFAETREQLGGFYMINAEHLDEALAIAARIPSARFGSIEVRPIRALPASYQAMAS